MWWVVVVVGYFMEFVYKNIDILEMEIKELYFWYYVCVTFSEVVMCGKEKERRRIGIGRFCFRF